MTKASSASVSLSHAQVVSRLHPPHPYTRVRCLSSSFYHAQPDTRPYKSHHCLDHRRVLVPICTLTALPVASQRPNPHPPHTRNVNHTTSPYQYHYRSRDGTRRNHTPQAQTHARSHHRVPFTPPTTGHLPYLPGSSKNPPSTFSPLPIFKDRSLRMLVGVSY